MEMQIHPLISKAAQELAKGRFLALFDSGEREAQADLVLHASFATPEKIALLRSEAGGMMCLATSEKVAETLELPFLAEALKKSGLQNVYDKTPYGDSPPFSIPINHKSAFTGVTDEDRSLAAREFSKLATRPNKKAFAEEFRTPGHLHLLVSRGLQKRRGHTEMTVKLCEIAGLPPAVLACEMLGFAKSLSQGEIQAKARQNGWVLVEGKDFEAIQ
ncbi:MAG: 3,4-dihydroxy-2-butanone-4-phosphate synthase [Candidatus Norongarragalinales archaeon]